MADNKPTNSTLDAPVFDHIMIYPERLEQLYLTARAKNEGLTPAEVALKCISERASGGLPQVAPAQASGAGTATNLAEVKEQFFIELIDWLSNQYHDPTAGRLHLILKNFRDGKPMPKEY
jgi:hypothetical protein